MSFEQDICDLVNENNSFVATSSKNGSLRSDINVDDSAVAIGRKLFPIWKELENEAEKYVADLKTAHARDLKESLEARDLFHNEIVTRLKDDVEHLKDRVDSLESNLAEKQIEIDRLRDKYSDSLSLQCQHMWKDRRQRMMFSLWKTVTLKRQNLTQLELVVNKARRWMHQSRLFSSWKASTLRAVSEREKQDIALRIDATARLTIGDLQVEVLKLRQLLADALSNCESEKLQREQLEEDVRRMLLKNVTSLNMETLSVFQHSLLPEAYPLGLSEEQLRKSAGVVIKHPVSSSNGDISMSDVASSQPPTKASSNSCENLTDLSKLLQQQQDQLQRSVKCYPWQAQPQPQHQMNQYEHQLQRQQQLEQRKPQQQQQQQQQQSQKQSVFPRSSVKIMSHRELTQQSATTTSSTHGKSAIPISSCNAISHNSNSPLWGSHKMEKDEINEIVPRKFAPRPL